MVLAIIILCLEINYLTYRYNLRVDVTQQKQHTLTMDTIEVLQEIKKEVKITAFYVGIPPKYLEDLLREYERNARERITTEIIDPIVQIGYASQFGHVISGRERKIIVQAGPERQDIDFTEEPVTEGQLTNAIIRVTRDTRYIYFLTGHREYSPLDKGDRGLKVFSERLLANNMVSKTLMLEIDQKIPEDCDVLVIAGPQDQLSKKEEALIKDYLKEGGEALFLIEHTLVTTKDKPLTQDQLNQNPSLNNILTEWGLKIANDIVVDLDNHASGDVGSPATRNYLTHKAIVEDLDYTFYVRPRSIGYLSKRRPSIKVAPLVLTASEKSSWGETDRTLKVQFDEILDRPGPVPIAYVIWEPKGEGKLSDTRIVVFTDADFLSNAYIDYYSNAQMGLNVMRWISEMDYRIIAGKKDIEVARLDLTSHQRRFMATILALIPLAIAVFGLIVWGKRRTA